MTRKRNPAYSEDFRKEAVKRASKKGVTQAQVAKELGVSAQQIANWKRQFTRLSDKQFNSVDDVDYSKKESEELRRLRRDHLYLGERQMAVPCYSYGFIFPSYCRLEFWRKHDCSAY